MKITPKQFHKYFKSIIKSCYINSWIVVCVWLEQLACKQLTNRAFLVYIEQSRSRASREVTNVHVKIYHNIFNRRVHLHDTFLLFLTWPIGESPFKGQYHSSYRSLGWQPLLSTICGSQHFSYHYISIDLEAGWPNYTDSSKSNMETAYPWNNFAVHGLHCN